MEEQKGLAGSLLIAMPQLQDPNFHRTVLLMVHHDENSSFGLVLNRSVDLTVGDLFQNLDFDWGGNRNECVSLGGPVEVNSGWILFDDDGVGDFPDEEVSVVRAGINFSGSLDVFRSVAAAPPPDFRFFLGYAGWGPGQLEYEIANGAWLSAPVSHDVVFETPLEEMWERVVRGLGIDPSTLVSTSGVH